MTVAPAATVPNAATTVPFVPTGGPRHAPWLAEQARNVVAPGSGSDADTAVAAIAPVFTTEIVNVTVPPGATGLGAADFVTPIVATSGVGVGVGVGVAVASRSPWV